MIRNYIKTAYRSLLKNKGFTAINTGGLALGLATCMLIVFYVADEVSFDKYNVKADRIIRVNETAKFGGNTFDYASCPAPLAAALKSDLPAVENSVRLTKNGEHFRIRKGSENIKEYNVVYADPALFNIFTLPMIDGSPSSALIEPHSAVITESTAKKYFNRVNAVGQTFLINDTSNYKITGVIKDIPNQSHFNFDFFLSMSSLPDSRETSWLGGGYISYILLRQGADQRLFESNLKQLTNKFIGRDLQSQLNTSLRDFEKTGNYVKFSINPLNTIHLQSDRVGELGHNGNLQYIYIFSAIALFILLIACVNFINLSTARSSSRAREVGVRKVLGSPRKYLVFQFLTESILVSLAAAVIALVLALLLLPAFNQMAGKQLAVSPQLLIWIIPSLLAVVFIIGLLAGSYPAFFLSAFQPINVLKGNLAAGFKGGGLRSFLVVFQFAISIFLIIGTMVIYNQLHYIQNKNLGFNRDEVLVVHDVNVLGNQAKVLKNKLKQLPGVINTTMTSYLPTSEDRNSRSLVPEGAVSLKQAILSQYWPVDEDYINTLGIKMVKGRNFSTQFKTDSTGVVVNEAFAKLTGFSDPLGKKLIAGGTNVPYHIIGVMKDFNFNSLKEKITPVVLFEAEDRGALSIRLKTTNLPALMSQIKADWNQLSPAQQFSFSFMDEDFDAAYRTEQRIGTIFITFSSLAIIIACLGLFGLAAYAAEQRNKEIGIRKVLGANVSTIVGMLSMDFIKLVLISIFIATPVAWWAMNKWLQDFAYRTTIQWYVLAAAGLTAIIIAFITISFQSIKAALMNPVDSLRSE